MKTSINQRVIDQLNKTIESMANELERIEDIASNAPAAIDRAYAGSTAANLREQLTTLEGVTL